MNRIVHGSLWRSLPALAVPMFVSAFLQNLQSVIDLYWVGSLGSASVAALAISGTTLMILFPVAMGMATGAVALVSRRIGAGEADKAADVAGQALTLAFVAGILAGAVGWVFAGDICRLLGASDEVLTLARTYLRITFAGAFTMFVLFVGNSVLQAAGNTVIPMCIMGAANVLNLILDPLLIFGWCGFPAMGVAGAAIATVIAQLLAAAGVVAWLVGGRLQVRADPRFWRLTLAVSRSLVGIGLPGSGQMLARGLMSMALMRVVAAGGTSAVAAYGIGLRLHMILLMPAFALGNAAATMVGQNLGAENPRRAAQAALMAVAAGLAIMAAGLALFVPFAGPIVRVFDATPVVVAIGRSFIVVTFPFLLFSVPAIVLGRALNGAGDTLAPMVSTIVALWGVQVPLAILLSRTMVPGTTGIWWAISVAGALHGLMVSGWFVHGSWKRRKI